MRWAALLGLILPILAGARQIVLATGARAGLADNQHDCSFQGHVRRIRIEHSGIGKDGRESKHELRTSCSFDRRGHQLEDLEYRDQGQYGTAVTRWVFFYDSHGRRIEGDVSDTDEDSKHPRRFLTKYDSKGRESEEVSVDPDGSIDSRVVKEYDSRGDIAKEITYESDGKPSGVTIRHYDAGHHVIEEDLGTNPEAVSKRIFRYNDKGQRIEDSFEWEGAPARQVYEYDERGRLRSFETITGAIPAPIGNVYGLCGDCGLFPGKTTYRYNDEGLLTEERVIQPGNKLIRLSEYAYDSHGRHTRAWVYSSDPSGTYSREDLLFDRSNGLRSTSYTYDSHGNWVKAVETRLSSDRDLNSDRIVDSVQNLTAILETANQIATVLTTNTSSSPVSPGSITYRTIEYY
jgi:hypothetical protein